MCITSEIGNIHNIIPKRRGLVTLGVCDICLVFKAVPPQSSFTKQLQSTPFPPSCYSLYSTHPFPTNSPSPQIYPVPTTNERLCPNNPEPHPTLSTTTVHIASNLYREALSPNKSSQRYTKYDRPEHILRHCTTSVFFPRKRSDGKETRFPASSLLLRKTAVISMCIVS